MNWEECRMKKLVKETKEDISLIKSLIEQSNKKIITDNFSPLNKDTVSTKFCNNYDSLREILEALALQKGFKIYNHECFSGFLKDILKMEKESFDFDKIRKIRNSVNYYGQDISILEGKEWIKEIKNLKEKLIRLLEVCK